jgi:hypothetical protein
MTQKYRPAINHFFQAMACPGGDFEIWTTMENHYPKMTALAITFPTLDKAKGIEPFIPTELDAWACGPTCHGAEYAARFVLAVFYGRMGRIHKPRQRKDEGVYRFPVETPWRCGPFDAVDAMSTWDTTHRAAFVAWCREPWWP